MDSLRPLRARNSATTEPPTGSAFRLQSRSAPVPWSQTSRSSRFSLLPPDLREESRPRRSVSSSDCSCPPKSIPIVTDCRARLAFAAGFGFCRELLRFFMAGLLCTSSATGSLPHPVGAGLLIPSRREVDQDSSVRSSCRQVDKKRANRGSVTLFREHVAKI